MTMTEKPNTRPFFILWTGQALSLLGSQAVQFALIWWLTLQTESATVLATASFLGLFPQAILGPAIGALVDRWNRKRIMFFADASVAVASVVLAILFATGTATITHVFALLFLRALGGAFHTPAMMASTSLMVPKDLLARIQGLNQGLQGGLLVISAPIGAFLVSWLPMAGVMVIDVVTALVAVVPLIFIHVPQPERSGGDSEAAGGLRSVATEVAEGVRYLWQRSGHFGVLGLVTLINLFMVPAFSLLPLLVTERGGDAQQLGWLTSAFGIGTLGGGILLAVWGGFRRHILTTLTALFGIGLAVLALTAAQQERFLFSLASIFGVGFFVALVNGPIQALLQATIAPEVQGRIFTLYGSLATLASPVGLILAAPIAEWLGVLAWYVAGGVICLLMGAIGFATPRIRRLGIELEEGDPAEVSPPEATSDDGDDGLRGAEEEALHGAES